jgi:hypothetical protein
MERIRFLIDDEGDFFKANSDPAAFYPMKMGALGR